MTLLGFLVFIIIVSVGQLYFSHKRKQIVKMIERDRRSMLNAVQELKSIH